MLYTFLFSFSLVRSSICGYDIPSLILKPYCKYSQHRLKNSSFSNIPQAFRARLGLLRYLGPCTEQVSDFWPLLWLIDYLGHIMSANLMNLSVSSITLENWTTVLIFPFLKGIGFILHSMWFWKISSIIQKESLNFEVWESVMGYYLAHLHLRWACDPYFLSLKSPHFGSILSVGYWGPVKSFNELQ